jgi:DNA polymerase III alpha subunit (gram-positive type)
MDRGTRNEVLEIAAIKFGYADDQITSVIDTFQGFRQPSAPIEPPITKLTGITHTMVDGHQIDGADRRAEGQVGHEEAMLASANTHVSR